MLGAASLLKKDDSFSQSINGGDVEFSDRAPQAQEDRAAMPLSQDALAVCPLPASMN